MIQVKSKVATFDNYFSVCSAEVRKLAKAYQFSTNLIFRWLGYISICLLSTHAVGKERNLSCTPNDGQTTAISDGYYINIGGVKQWITINGKNCNNPVVLMVHGGPGNPLSTYHDSLFKEFEEDFTIVHWDQRGAGRTYQAQFENGKFMLDNITNNNLSLGQLVVDGIEISDYLIELIGHEKIIISGSSWGAFLATKMIHVSPDNFHFYVGLSPLVNGLKNYTESYKKVKSIAEDKNDKAALEMLKKIGPPIWSHPASYGKLRRLIKKYEDETIKNPANWHVGKEYAEEVSSPGYMFAEEFSFLKYIGLNDDGLVKQVRLDECCSQLKIPIYLLQGQKDLLTVPSVTYQYFEKINAPAKDYVELEHSGHDQTVEMLKMQLLKLKAGAAEYIK